MAAQAQSPVTVNSANELVILGAGLSGLLTAWRVLDVNPDVSVRVVEKADRIAGDHTWSFNDSDVSPELLDWLEPFIAYRWDRYDVRFPRRERTLDIGYCTGGSEGLRSAVAPLMESGRLIVELSRAAAPDDFSGRAVLDARGYALRDDELPGWQKFVGRVIKTAEPHGVTHPVIMDATVEQLDGYRFFYLLPYSNTEMLVEDTYFSDSAQLSENEIGARIDDYIRDKGWSDHRVLRSEKGVLPMMMATDRDDASAEIGLRGGFAVAATGFTVPHAVELADVVAQAVKRGGVAAAPGAVAKFRARHLRRERYARLLNRMFFRAASPDKRYIVLQRFYGLREGLIRRFYRNGLTRLDKARILIGKPPVPVNKAIANMSETAFIRRERRTKGSHEHSS